MVSPWPEAMESTPPPRRWPFRVAVVLLVLIGLIAASTFIHLHYYAIAPGSATPVSDYVVVPKGQAYPPKGHVLLVTVSFSNVTPIEYLLDSINRDALLISKKEANSGVPKGQNLTQYNQQLMDDSEKAAVVVALRKLGYDVPERGDGAFVIDVRNGGPSQGHLTGGDTIVALGGQPVHTLDDATAAIHAHHPGEAVPVVVHPARGPDRTEQVSIGHRVPGKDGATCEPTSDPSATDPCLGVIIQTRNQRFDNPVNVKIDAGNIGGPSAGLSFTIGLIDELTPGELTGGKTIAITGTIDIAGNVGPVGGVRQKTAAAISAGARYFLVPPDEYGEAVARAKGHHLEVIKVSTLDEALAVLGRLGGDVSAVGARAASGH